eukprot:g65793.t1
MSKEKAVLCYGRCSIYKEDAELLQGNYWLNDNVISFAFEYLTRAQKDSKVQAMFVSPGVSYIIMHENDKEDLEDTVKGCKLSPDKHMFLPVSDKAIDKIGGGHWALLVWDKDEKAFSFWDSSGSMNAKKGRLLASQLCPFLVGQPAAAALKDKFHLRKGPQQENSYDCGMYVLATAQLLSSRLNQGKSMHTAETESWLKTQLSAKSAANLRREWNAILQDLIKSAKPETKKKT